MKSGTVEILKFKKLARRLRLPQWQCVGLLESLWQFAAKNAPQGDVGRFSNEDLAIAIEWNDCENELVSALLDTGWIDESKEHRLVIHDWHDHAPTYIRGNLARSGRAFLTKDGTKEPRKDGTKEPRKDGTKEPRKDSTKEPRKDNPSEGTTKPSQTKPNQASPPPSESDDGEEEDVACEILELYPKRVDGKFKIKALAEIRSAIDRDGIEKVRQGTAQFARYFRCWKDGTARFAAAPAPFFANGEYLEPDSKNQNLDPEKYAGLQRELADEAERERRERRQAKLERDLQPYREMMGDYEAELSSNPVEMHEEIMLEFIDEMNRTNPSRDVSDYLDKWAQKLAKKAGES